MSILQKVLKFVLALIKTFRLALPKLGVGWMFALLTVNFNRVAIVELNITAVVITVMLAMHYFLSPFQVISGRIADRNPILGMRRTPYLILAAIVSSLIFMALPSTAIAIGNGSMLALAGGFGLLTIYGVAIAVFGDAHHSLIAETVEAKSRGGVIAVVWTFTILSSIIAAVVTGQMMPEYDPAVMQMMYNLTPIVVIGSALLGVVGIEKRMSPEETAEAVKRSKEIVSDENPIKAALHVLRTNKAAWGFFAFIFVSIFSIFLQDNILEPFGAQVFGMNIEETSGFQQTWGGGVLIGMILIGIISSIFNISKRKIALVGAIGTAAGMAMLAYSSMSQDVGLVDPSLTIMGFATGFFNVGALAMMMDMTVDGATGLYMGLWGMAQAFGNGLSGIVGGALYSGLIETGFMEPHLAFFAIFGFEAIGMVAAAMILLGVSVQAFQASTDLNLNTADALNVMEVGMN